MKRDYKSKIYGLVFISLIGGIMLSIAGVVIIKSYDDNTRILGWFFIVITILLFISIPFTLRRGKREINKWGKKAD